MVRVFIKGGVWKNSEDEILKAAVMKYGKQQWARVASLLNRKSAKQCKARWNEWLDPSVRKVEWSREEDEKLLHLAKLMPAQWRTIGPLVGRTGGQCQERYERLLDEAAGGGEVGGDEDGVAGGAIAARKLRPGEIDPHPESKPARPDPIDMDEDEVEMLQEARARLANTQGKKAKRKAREKMLADAKRLADLQKRRELKAAGLMSGAAKSRSKKRLRDIDLGVEIPFHKPAPAGFHATGDEDDRAESAKNQRLKDVDYKRIHEMQYRQRDREAKERQKREEARLRSLERSNMQYVVAEVAKRNDPISSRKRGVLTMPEPTIADDELRRVAKASEEEKEALASLAAAGGAAAGGATSALLGDYSDRPLPTPMRTPASSSQAGKPSRSDVIQREAMNLRALSTGQTPLLGDENAELLEGGAGTGVGLAETAAAAAAYGATPMLGGASVADDATAGMKRKASSRTPLTQASSHRDELGLNARNKAPSEVGAVITNDDASVGASSFGASTFASRLMSVRELAKEERRRAKRARKELEDALANLPAPQFEYELAVPEDVTMEEADEDERVGRKVHVKDAAELDAEEIKRMQKEAEKLYEEQSSVIKRPDLPRPKSGAVLDRLQDTVTDEDLAMVSAAKLINEELATLISHDAYAHPVQPDKKDPIFASLMSEGKKNKKDKKRKQAMEPETHLDYIPEDSLETANQLLEDELKAVLKEKRELLSSTTGKYYENDSDVLDAVVAETVQAASGSASQLSFSTNGWEQGVEGNDRTAETLYAEYTAIQNATNAVAKACSKLEQKLEIQTGGYNQRSQSLINSSMQSFAMLQHSKIEAVVYSRLRSHETRGAQLRMERLKDEIERLEEEETKKQKKYGELVHTKNRLQLKIRSQGSK